MADEEWAKQQKAHQRAVDAARTAVARRGFVFHSLLGSDKRIHEIYRGNKKADKKRIKRRSSLPSVITPLSPAQFLAPKLRGKKSAPSTKFLPVSKGSIGVRMSTTTSVPGYRSIKYLNKSASDSRIPKMMPIPENLKPSIPQLPLTTTKAEQNEPTGGAGLALVTPESIFSEDENVRNLHDKLLSDKVEDEKVTAPLLGASRSSDGVMQHPNIVKQHKIIEKMLEYGHTNSAVSKLQVVPRRTLSEENVAIQASVGSIYGNRRAKASVKDRVDGRTFVIDNKMELYESKGKALSARGEKSRDRIYFAKEVMKYNIIIRGQKTGTFSNTKAATIKNHFCRGYAHAQIGNLKRALEDFSRCLEIDSNMDQVLYNRAMIFRRLECHASALKDLHDAVRRARSLENKTMYITSLAFVKRELGQFLEAGEELRRNMTTLQYIKLVQKNSPESKAGEKKKKSGALNNWGAAAIPGLKRKKSIFTLSNTVSQKKKKGRKEAAALMGVLKARKKFKRVLNSPYAYALSSAGRPGERSPEKVEELYEVLSELKAFQDLPKEIVHLFCMHANIEHVTGGSYVYKIGDPMNKLYVVAGGILRLMKHLNAIDRNSVEVTARQIEEGDWFGGVIAGEVHPAAVYVQTSCELLCLDHSVLEAAKPAKVCFAALLQQRVSTLEASFVFNAMSKEMVNSVAIAGRFENFPVDTVLLSEGQTVDKFYVIKRGVCKVLRKISSRRKYTSHNELLWKNQYRNVLHAQRELAKPGTASLMKRRDVEDNVTFQSVQVSTLGPGDILGELAILSNRTHVPSPVTVVADTGLLCQVITANEIREFVANGYFSGAVKQRLIDYMCIKVPSEPNVKLNVDIVSKWTQKKSRIVHNNIKVSSKNGTPSKSRVLRLGQANDVSDTTELKRLGLSI
jgi:CRP-like cAMP-binding protein/tetratricopeptide (TPR) repeat protein